MINPANKFRCLGIKNKGVMRGFFGASVLIASMFFLAADGEELSNNPELNKVVVAVDVINGTLPSSIHQELVSAGFVIRFIKKSVTSSQLEGVNALLVCAPFKGSGVPPVKGVKHHELYGWDEVKAVVDFVRNGGALIGAGQVWSWQSYGAKPVKDHPLNQLGSGLGFKIEGTTVADRFLESTISSAPKLLKLDTTAIYSIVDVGRSFREKVIISEDDVICAAQARRAKGMVCIFGHELVVMDNPGIIAQIARLSAGSQAPGSVARKSNDSDKAGDENFAGPDLIKVSGEAPLDVLSIQSPNAIGWLTSPLDVAVPPELREGISILRENILDMGLKDMGNKEVYVAGAALCKAMVMAIDYRDKRQSAANLKISKAKADSPMSNQALNARRNYQMSWPQYEREIQQRSILEKQRLAVGEVEFNSAQAKWTETSVVIRKKLDHLFQDFRKKKRAMDSVK